MPEISRFFGIVITMYVADHTPPHFHARYGDAEGLFNIDSGEMIRGQMPRRAIRLVQEWWELHKGELMHNFEEAQKENPVFKRIEPLV